MLVPRYWRIGLGAALALSVTAAFAADQVSPYPECTNRKPSPQDLEGAKGAHKAASQFYDRGDYDKAIRYWNDAYSFDCTANDLLINVANAQEKKGDRAGAVITLKVYLQRVGSNPTIEQKVKNLEQLLAATPTATVTVPPAPTTVPTAAPSVTATGPTSPPEGPRPYGFTPWIVVGGGAAVTIIGAILLPVGNAAIADAAKSCPEGPNPDGSVSHHCPKTPAGDAAVSKGTAGRSEVAAGGAMLGVGLAAVAGGIVWQLLLNKPRAVGAPKALQLVPVLAPGHAGISLGGAF